jgi:hypothetical protein
MDNFPKDLQYFIVELFFENKQEIILLYTDSNFSNPKLCGYYPLEKIIQEKIEIEKYLFGESSRCGNIRLMIFLYENGCPWDSFTFTWAAEHGNLENMQWLLEKECPWSCDTFIYAAKHGSLENMQWLFEKGCPWDNWTFVFSKKHEKIVQWLLDNGCPS